MSQRSDAGTHGGHRKRFKQQFMTSGDHFHDHQLLEVLLYYSIPQGDVNPVAHRLMETFGSIAGVLDAHPAELQKVAGIGEHTAVLLKLIPKISARYNQSLSALGTIIRSTKEAERYLAPYFRMGVRNEMVYLLCMDGKHKVLGCYKMGEGSVHMADIAPRKILEAALAHNAATVILAHNHVSGLALPSDSDLYTTDRLTILLSAVDITLVDHLIFTQDDMVSLRDSGLLKGQMLSSSTMLQSP